MATNTNFPVFAANQVLKNDHLNDLVNYLEEQTRLTRSKTIGIGILCGFQMDWTKALDNLGRQWDSLNLSEGVGITSSGYLIHSPKKSFSHRRRYLKTMELSQLEEFMASSEFYEERFNQYKGLADIYEFFKDDSGDDIEELYELVPVENDKDNAQPLSRTFINNKVLLVYLNCDLQSLKNCDINDCDDKGAKLQFEIRYLLAPEHVAQKIQEREQAKMKSVHMPIHLADRPYANLNEVALEKLDYFASPPVFHRDLFNQYINRIKNAFTDLSQELKNTFTSFNFLLKDIYSSESETKMFSQLDTILENASNLTGNNRYQMQYYYDFAAHLIDAYHEFLCLARQYNNLCHLGDQLFPKHLMLGKLTHIEKNLIKDGEFAVRNPFIETGEGFFPDKETNIPYRHRFITSPQHALQQDIMYKLQTQHVKIYEMLVRFNPALIINKSINILPSKDASYKLSNRDVIPGYFPVSDTANNPQNKLKRLWSYSRTLKGQFNKIYSYHTHQNNPVLQFRQTDTNFYRIEGHIGQNLDKAVDAIESLRLRLGLDFEIKLLNMTDRIDSKSLSVYPVDLYRTEINKHPGLQSMSGVPAGGTFYIAYEVVTSRPFELGFTDQLAISNIYLKALGSVSNNLEVLNKSKELVNELSIVSTKPGVYSEEFNKTFKMAMEQPKYTELRATPVFNVLNDEINSILVSPNNVTSTPVVVGDFALSYVCCDSSFGQSLGVVECNYRWIDNYQFLSKYSWEGNTNDYKIHVLEYTISDTKLVTNSETITIKLASIAHQKLMAVLLAINIKYPTGLVFGLDPKSKSNFTIKHIQNQTFTLKLRRDGSNDVYTYTEKEWLKNGLKTYSSGLTCKLLPRKYNSEDYKYLQQEYAFTGEFVYDFPPTDKDHMTWQKKIKMRRITVFSKLPDKVQNKLKDIYAKVLEIDANAKLGLGGSWIKGSWATNETFRTDKEFVELREKITGKNTASDIDIVIQSKKAKMNPNIFSGVNILGDVNVIGIETVDSKKHIPIPRP